MQIDDRQRFTLRCPGKLLRTLGEKANQLGVPINSLILQILWDWVKQNTKE